MDRRKFLAATGLAVASAPWGIGQARTTRRFSPDIYARSVVIDALAGLGAFTPEAAADIKASGVTALNLTVSAVGNSPDSFEETIRSIANAEAMITANPNALLRVTAARDIDVAKATGRLGVIYGFQDTSMLEGDLSRLTMFQNLGVRVVQLVYNRRNLMGDGCLEPADGGLSTLGRECIAEINSLNMLLDLSHAGPSTIAQGIAASKARMAITHTGCRALVDVPRNTHDRELKALADKGGVVGMYLMPFLRASGQPRAEDLIRHLEHAVNVCGEDHVGIGTDGGISGQTLDAEAAKQQREFYERRAKAGIASPGEAADVFNLIPEYNEPRRLMKLADDLTGRGWTTGRVEKILGANFRRLFAEVWAG